MALAEQAAEAGIAGCEQIMQHSHSAARYMTQCRARFGMVQLPTQTGVQNGKCHGVRMCDCPLYDAPLPSAY